MTVDFIYVILADLLIVNGFEPDFKEPYMRVFQTIKACVTDFVPNTAFAFVRLFERFLLRDSVYDSVKHCTQPRGTRQ